jgi:hypothetical protein
MFVRRRRLDRRRKYTREFLESLVGQLREAGFDHVSVVLPHNYESVDPTHPEEDIDAFLERGRNFAAVILKAVNQPAKETLKLLFVNSNKRAVFADDTFPMAESEPSGLYFESPDPARAYAVFEYFFEYLSQPSIADFVAITFLGLASGLYLVLESIALLSRGRGVLQLEWSASMWWDAASILLAGYLVFRFSATPTGLWIKPSRELNVVYLVNMALKGELRDNPIVQLVVTIVGGLIVAGITRLLGWF